MKAHGTYYSATLMAFSGVQALMGSGKLSPESEAKARQTFDVWGKGLNLAYRTGVKIALGTDSAVAPHNLANKELELMVSKGGMTPRDALIAATKGGPDLLDISNETGTLDPGKSADLIAVDGDPLVDPTAVTRVGYVMVARQAHPDGLNDSPKNGARAGSQIRDTASLRPLKGSTAQPLMRRQVHRGILAATIDLDLELEPVALVERRHAGALDGRNVHERVRLSVIALNEAEALHRVEELDDARRLLARQLTLRRALGAFDRHRLTVDSKVGRRDAAATIDERELERLAVGEVGQTGLLDRRDVHEHVLAAVIADDEAEALLRVEELYDALAFADDLGGHSATATAAAATKAAAAAAAAETAAAAAEAIAAATATAAATAAAAEAITAAAVSTAAAATAKAAAVGESAAIAVAAASLTTEEIVALVTAATTAVPLTPSIETHTRPNSLCPQSLRTNALGPKSATGQARICSRTVQRLTAKKRASPVIPECDCGMA